MTPPVPQGFSVAGVHCGIKSQAENEPLVTLLYLCHILKAEIQSLTLGQLEFLEHNLRGYLPQSRLQ